MIAMILSFGVCFQDIQNSGGRVFEILLLFLFYDLEEELWMEVCNIVQKVVIKTIPRKKNCKKAEWLSEEALQIVEKRIEVKDKGEKERCTHLNAEFQRIARGDKKAFLSEQRKEIEEKKQNGKDQRSLQENQRYQGTFHAKMGTIKDRNGMDLTGGEDIKRYQEYTELYKTKSS